MNLRKKNDALRDEIMNILGLRIIRFSNIEVLNNLEKVKTDLNLIVSS